MDLGIVWDTTKRDLPALRGNIRKAMAKIGNEE
ncbi:hypothetical protein [Rhizobium sp.]